MLKVLVKLLLMAIVMSFLAFNAQASVRLMGRDVKSIAVNVSILRHKDGNVNVKTNVPLIDRKAVQDEVEKVFTADTCLSKIPLNQYDPVREKFADSHLFLSIRIAVQDSLEGATCNYQEACGFASVHIFVNQGKYSASSHTPRLIVAENSELQERLIEAAIAETKTFINQAFPPCPERK